MYARPKMPFGFTSTAICPRYPPSPSGTQPICITPWTVLLAISAANSSSISDGAAALVLARGDAASKHGLKPIARIVAQASNAAEPRWFTTAPVKAIERVLERAGWKKSDVDLYEINEAFAVVAMIALRDLGLSQDIVNVNGGACALGHPIGASGARVVVTLANALRRRGLKRGVASLCIGGGEATAMAIELMN